MLELSMDKNSHNIDRTKSMKIFLRSDNCSIQKCVGYIVLP